jgi:predicted nucleotidyltransferase
MVKSKEIFNIIKNTVRYYFPEAEVMLFGSRASETASSDSDYDILIITRQTLTPKQKLPIKSKIRKALLKKEIRSDILIQSKKEIQTKKNLPGHIIRNFLNEAVSL